MTSSLQIPAEFSSEKNEIDEQVAKFYSYCLLYFVFFIVVFVLPIVVK